MRLGSQALAGRRGRRSLAVVVGSLCLLWQACAPPPRHVVAKRPAPPPLPEPRSSSRPDEPRGAARTVPAPAIEESELKEAPEPRRPAREPAPDEALSLLAKIEPQTPPRRAASLRLAEEGRRLLVAQQYRQALAKFEQSLGVDSTNAYSYFYLAKAHYSMGRYRESLNFLDVAESRLGSESAWLAEIHSLRGDNYRALGFPGRAEGSYVQALRIDPQHPGALDGMSRLRGAGR